MGIAISNYFSRWGLKRVNYRFSKVVFIKILLSLTMCSDKILSMSLTVYQHKPYKTLLLYELPC